MRLWHQSLIHYLPRQQLLGQHRECCALRGKGWGKKHSVVDYVFKHDLGRLYMYHIFVMHEMASRNYFINDVGWYNRLYRGKNLPSDTLVNVGSFVCGKNELVYPEHNDSYLKECLLNLKSKGAELINGMTIEEMLINLDMNNIE